MIYWLVTWIVVSCWCAPGSPAPDEYGRHSQVMYAVCNYECSESEHERYFDSEYEALRFIVRGEESSVYHDQRLKDFKLEPVRGE